MIHNTNTFVHNQRYVICKQHFAKDLIAYKCDRRQIYYNKYYYTHQ